MNISLTVEGARINGTLDGRDFSIIRKGCETRLEGIHSEDGTFGGMVSSALLDFGCRLLDGINILIDETDQAATWRPLSDDVAEAIHDAMI